MIISSLYKGRKSNNKTRENVVQKTAVIRTAHYYRNMGRKQECAVRIICGLHVYKAQNKTRE